MELNSYSNKFAFSSRNIRAREIDKICRDVRLELPVHSSTLPETYHCYPKRTKAMTTVRELCKKVRVLRNSYNYTDKWVLKMIDGMKKYKIGNCNEQADALNVALRANGYKNVNSVSLFAYNTKTKSIRDLDHIVVGVDLKLPKNYQYYGDDFPHKKQLIEPHNGSIIADPWAGFVDTGKGYTQRYKENTNIFSPLKKDEKLMYGVLPSFELTDTDFAHLKTFYPGFYGARPQPQPQAKLPEGRFDRIKKQVTNIINKILPKIS